MARSTEYDETALERAKTYLAECADFYEQRPPKGEESGAEIFRVRLPSVASLAVYLGVARSTVYKWADQNDAFADILELILAEQEKRLIENGLAGTYNSSIAKLALGKHGYKEGSHVTHEVGETLADLMRDGDGNRESTEA